MFISFFCEVFFCQSLISCYCNILLDSQERNEILLLSSYICYGYRSQPFITRLKGLWTYYKFNWFKRFTVILLKYHAESFLKFHKIQWESSEFWYNLISLSHWKNLLEWQFMSSCFSTWVWSARLRDAENLWPLVSI